MRYTVEGGKELHEELPHSEAQGSYDLQLLGPNGFVRHWAGLFDSAAPEVLLAYRPEEGSLELRARSRGAEQQIVVSPNVYPTDVELRLSLPESGEWQTRVWSVSENGNWYDFTVRSSLVPTLTYRFAGRLETGEDGVTDPALGTFTV
jgi:phospholipase C